ncbi:MAG: S-methyl-5-thioribose-1-phosphate isomerase [Chromatiales bacterium 21-64-14]|nr:MAG: S-methyl-5-thioribose-1-phosphate isomerase [Chromatiales bacterium 21-64-14]HQU15374.1 S-methyl-5-thioribose-1-phosphate isomerase [Gammaproteobacteria bacterium]
MNDRFDTVRAVEWHDGRLRLLDQRVLPGRTEHLELTDAAGVAWAIHEMVVRGAPAIGITAAYGVVLAAAARWAQAGPDWTEALREDLAALAAARPTAVNLAWALERMGRRIAALAPGDPTPDLLTEARAIHQEDIAANRRMGELGAAQIQGPCGVLTHCNTGSLATGGYGTALGVIRSAYRAGKLQQVYADETRPWLQGARLTAWELLADRIPVTILVDGAAAHLMRSGKVQWLIVGADRVAANGDVANKIGTYSAAIAARYHGVRFMVVAPSSTLDLETPDGAAIPIEQRAPREVLNLAGQPVAPEGVDAWNPAFDVTPAELVDVLVTEKGVVHRPDRGQIEALLKTYPANV